MINLFEKIHKRKRKSNLELQIYSFEFPLVILSNTSIIAYCALVAKLKIDYTPLQMAVLVILSAMMMIIFNVLFYHTNIKLLSNKIIYWQSTGLTTKGRTDLLRSIGVLPIQKAIHLGTLFVLNGLLYSCGAYYFQHADLHICIFYFHMYVSLAYIVILIEIFVLENKCSKIASAIVAQGVELSNKKTFGLSQNAYFILYFVIPILGTSLISFHTIYYSFHSQTVFSETGTVVSRFLSDTEKMGFFIKTTLTRSEAMAIILKITFANALSTSLLIYFYYARMAKNTALMQNSLVLLKNKKIDQKNLFETDLFSEFSYTMYLINRTILIFDSLIRNNVKTNQDIEEVTRLLSQISNQTKENVIKQSANIEEILATMQSVKHLSKKIESSFDEVITVASKTLDRIDFTSSELNDNFNKMQEITDTNRITIDNLRKLSAKIIGIQDVINLIDKIAEQTKTVAFNAELEANNIDVKGIDFSNVAEETRRLSDNTMDLTRAIHDQIIDITQSSEELIATGNYCMTKTEEGNEICSNLKSEFENIKRTAHDTAINSTSLKDSLYEQSNSFHQIVETLSQIAKSVRNFGTSATNISDTIEKLRKSSSHILELNNKYDNTETKQEGNAI